MPRYFCDYCQTYLTHDSAPGRKQHNRGWKHRENVKTYYEQYLAAWEAARREAQFAADMAGGGGGMNGAMFRGGLGGLGVGSFAGGPRPPFPGGPPGMLFPPGGNSLGPGPGMLPPPQMLPPPGMLPPPQQGPPPSQGGGGGGGGGPSE